MTPSRFKSLLLALLLLLLLSPAAAQREVRLLVWQDSLFGLIDGRGQTVLPCEYEDLTPDRMFCNCDFCTGDLVFVRDTADLSRFSHVAVMECTDSGVYSFEVHPTMGVVRCGWEEWAKDWYALFDTTYGFTSYFEYRYVNVPYDKEALVSNLSHYMGVASSNIDDMMLVKRCYMKPNVQPLFVDESDDVTLFSESEKLTPFRIE